MIIGVGIDIVEIKRIEAAAKREFFLNKVFTAREREYCQNRGRHSFASYAARFAAKEAVSKAFGTGFYPGEAQDIEIINESTGRPSVLLAGKFLQLAKKLKVLKTYISLTHSKEYAVAQVILWGEDGADESGDSK